MSPATDLFYFFRAQRDHLSDAEAADAWSSLSVEQRRAFEYRLCKHLAELLDEQERQVARESGESSGSGGQGISGALYDESQTFLTDPTDEHNSWGNTPNFYVIGCMRDSLPDFVENLTA